MSECWCGGDLAGYSRHVRGDGEPCAASRLANTLYHREYVGRHRERIREYERKRVRGWRPGTAIALDDAL